jgi:hypothetical protein
MKNIVFIILTFFYISCANFKTNKLLYSDYKLSDLTQIQLEQYSINSNFYPILDSVIRSVNKCNNYVDMQIGFTFTAMNDSLDRLEFTISSIYDLYALNYNYCNGVFYYKGYQFLFYGVISSEILQDLYKSKRLFYLKPEKLRNFYDKRGEFFNSSWTYIFNSNKFKCVYYLDCNHF